MPNWCNNTLYIRADKEDMKELKDLLDKTLKFSKDNHCANNLLSAIIPMPKELENTISGSTPEKPEGDTPNWYDWCNDNWGTKWDVDCYETQIEDDYMAFGFDSAWAPPVPWLEKVAKLFPKLKFSLKYDDPGMEFMGCAKGSSGEIVDEYIEYSL